MNRLLSTRNNSRSGNFRQVAKQSDHADVLVGLITVCSTGVVL